MGRYWKRIAIITILGANVLIFYYNCFYTNPRPAVRTSFPPEPQDSRTVPVDKRIPGPEPTPEPGRNPNSIVIRFDPGKPELTAQAKADLVGILNALSSDATAKVRIDGHSDNTGRPDRNIILSIERAKFVRDYLIHLGVGESRIILQGYGETRPIATNDTKAGQAQNRRVEVSLIR